MMWDDRIDDRAVAGDEQAMQPEEPGARPERREGARRPAWERDAEKAREELRRRRNHGGEGGPPWPGRGSWSGRGEAPEGAARRPNQRGGGRPAVAETRFLFGLEQECLSVAPPPALPTDPAAALALLDELGRLAPSLPGPSGLFNAYGRVYMD